MTARTGEPPDGGHLAAEEPPDRPDRDGAVEGAGRPGERPHQPTVPDTHEADRRVVRRALIAGAGTAATGIVASLAVAAATGGDGVVAGVWALSGVVVGTLVASGWLVLSLGLDLIAGVVPGRRRVIWTVVVFVAAFLSPILPAAMLQVAASR